MSSASTACSVRCASAIEAVIGEPLDLGRCGTDGCSIPTYAAPLRAFAQGFARMATGKNLSAAHAEAARRLFDAATRHPHLVAGTDHPDTVLMTAFGGRLMQKGGAEGVQCGAIRDKGWGYAIKCDDGNMAASHAMLAATLLKIADPDAGQRAALETLATQTLKNVRKREIGTLRAVEPFPL
jgi:L-asparaginase II